MKNADTRKTYDISTTYSWVGGDSETALARVTVLADVLCTASLRLRFVVGTGVVRDTVIQDPGIGSCWVTTVTTFGVVGL